jgi:hypothetical protein
MKEFEVAREALLGLEEQLSEKRAEQTQQRIIALEHYLSVEVPPPHAQISLPPPICGY